MVSKVVIIGSGNMANSYIDVLKKNKRFEILGCFSRNKNKLKKFSELKNIPYLYNIDSVFNLKKRDLLIVAITATNLINFIKTIFDVKCTVLIEKPLGINLRESLKIFKKIKYKKNFFLALNRRYYGSTLQVQKKILNQKKIIYVEDHVNFEEFEKRGFNNKNKKYFFFSHSIHLIDYFNIFGKGKIVNIKRIYFKKKQIILRLDFSSGDVGIYYVTLNSKQKWNVMIFNKDRFFKLQPLEVLTIINRNYRKKFKYFYDNRYKPGLWRLINDILKKIDGKKNKLVSINEGLKIMTLVDKIYLKTQ
jgi:hypothetical protein